MSNNINWDTSIYLSDKKYSSSEISTITKGVLNIEKRIIEDLQLTAKDFDFVQLFKTQLKEQQMGYIVTGKQVCHIEKFQVRDRKSTRLNSSHITRSRMPSSA